MGDKHSLAVVIEDNALIAELIEDTCIENDYECLVYENAWDALAALTRVNPDIIVMDIYMPGLTGNDLLRRIAEPPYDLRTTPIAIITGDPDPTRIDPIKAELDVRVFVKPAGIGQIGDYLRELRERVPS